MKLLLCFLFLAQTSFACSPELLNLVKEYEGFSTKVYKCPAGISTIGYGFTDITSTTLSKKQAEVILGNKLDELRAKVKRVVPNCSNKQIDALTSLSYNIGFGAFRKSELVKKLKVNEKTNVDKEFLVFCKVNGKVVKGLENRRKSELEMFKGK